MMNETMIRNWISVEKSRLSALIDPVEKRFCEYTIGLLESVIGE